MRRSFLFKAIIQSEILKNLTNNLKKNETWINFYETCINFNETWINFNEINHKIVETTYTALRPLTITAITSRIWIMAY